MKQLPQPDGTITPGANWQIDVTDPLGIVNSYFTDTAGQLQVCGLVEGAYTVSENLPTDFVVVGLIVNGVTLPAQPIYSFTWTSVNPAPIITFQNVQAVPV
jgi:hypothetical protein